MIKLSAHNIYLAVARKPDSYVLTFNHNIVANCGDYISITDTTIGTIVGIITNISFYPPRHFANVTAEVFRNNIGHEASAVCELFLYKYKKVTHPPTHPPQSEEDIDILFEAIIKKRKIKKINLKKKKKQKKVNDENFDINTAIEKLKNVRNKI